MNLFPEWPMDTGEGGKSQVEVHVRSIRWRLELDLFRIWPRIRLVGMVRLSCRWRDNTDPVWNWRNSLEDGSGTDRIVLHEGDTLSLTWSGDE